MNTFNADALLQSPFSNKEIGSVRPFSQKNDITLSKSLAIYQEYNTFDDESFLSYLVVLDKNITNGMGCTPALKRNIIDGIISLQTLLSRQKNESWSVSASLVAVAEQLFFKACAEYLILTKNGPSTSSHILNSLSYQCGKAFNENEEKDVQAFSSSLSLASIISLALVEFSNIQALWEYAELPDRLVQEIIPEEGSIRRLRTTLFSSGLERFSSFNPEVSVKDIENHTERITPFIAEKDIYKILSLIQSFPPTSEESVIPFTPLIVSRVLFKSLPKPESFDLGILNSQAFTAMDAELYLVWTMLWCRLEVPRSSRLLYQSLPISTEQLKLWQSLVLYLNGNRKNPAVLIKIQKIMEIVRLLSKSYNLKLAFAAFRWMRRASYPVYWTDTYASKIGDAISNCVLPMRNNDHVFIVTTSDALIDVDEEARMTAILLKYNVSRLISNENYKGAEHLLLSCKSTEAKKDLIKLYDLWIKFATGADKQYVREKIEELESDASILSFRTPKISLDESVISNKDNFLNDTLSIFGAESPEDKIIDESLAALKLSKSKSPTSPFVLKKLDITNSPTAFSSPNGNARRVYFSPDTTSSQHDSMMSAEDMSFHSVQSEATTLAQNSFASALSSPYKGETSKINFETSGIEETEEVNSSMSISESNVSSNLNDSSTAPVCKEEDDYDNFCYELMFQKLDATRKMMEDFSTRKTNPTVSPSKIQEYNAKSYVIEQYEAKIKELEQKLAMTSVQGQTMCTKAESEGLSVHKGCLGCLEEYQQEKAIAILDMLSLKWNQED